MQTPMVLHYAVSPTSAGRVLILMSRRGVFDVVRAEQDASRADLLRAARARFPDTLLIADDGTHGSWAAAVVARLEGAHQDFAAPIDLPLAMSCPAPGMLVSRYASA